MAMSIVAQRMDREELGFGMTKVEGLAPLPLLLSFSLALYGELEDRTIE